ncbi:uncharacterized protein TNCV_1876141 [Trichonephila clavipes]|nr:uncharacterized protein TNCV_1876141 [Trichonephila clavipes]
MCNLSPFCVLIDDPMCNRDISDSSDHHRYAKITKVNARLLFSVAHLPRTYARDAFMAWGTLNNRRASSPLVRLVEEEERWETPDHPQGVLPQNWGETKLNRSVSCMVHKATANDRRHLALYHDEFRGP